MMDIRIYNVQSLYKVLTFCISNCYNQLYEFNSWGEALEFYKKEHEHFTIKYHFTMPEVLPF